jgi:4-hydroxythreonine-4-phosphate dehydrogenase
MKPRVAITMGDPAGVGPELILKALAARKVRAAARAVVVGDGLILAHLAKSLKLRAPVEGEVKSLSNLNPKSILPGRASPAASRAMISYIEEGVRMTLAEEVDAIVTGPINKEAARGVGFRFPGHTEFLADLTGAKNFAMMLAGEDLLVVPVTTHVPLADVPALITPGKILKTIMVTDAAFKSYFNIKRARIAVAGLNPHAGEGGLFGKEEKSIIAPAVKKARSLGIDARGPLPADTVFYMAAVRREFDCVVCMYHDQGLGPMKLLNFDDGVNITLGLPIIRTSVDHGTAYDIAWKGEASAASMINAILTAARMARARAKA